MRKIGERNQDLSGESTAVVLKKAKALIRIDFGGMDHIEAIRNKYAKLGIDCGEVSAKVTLELIHEQIEGNRNRIYPRLDEAIRRLEKTEKTIERLP